jgi:acyl-CoA thioesterase-1
MRQLLLIILLILLSCGLGLNPAVAGKPSLLVLGDSLSAAYGINSDQGWVHLLQLRLSEQGYPQQVINASVSGDTSRNGLSRLPALLQAHQPGIIIIALGANDGLRGLALNEIKNNLRQMILLSQQQGCRVVLAGVRLPPNYGEEFNRQFAGIYQQLAGTAKISLVPRLLDQVADYSPLMQADGMHPTAAGQPHILENIWPVLKPLLGTDSQVIRP